MIFYFSGTGNSKYVAETIAQSTGDTIISMSDCIRNEACTFTLTDDEKIGFIFPTYFWGVPTIVADFIKKLELKNYTHQYVYSIVTCGQEYGNLFAMLEKLLSPKGITLKGTSKVILPDNYILLFNLLPTPDKQQEIFIEAEPHINELINQITNKCLPLVQSSVGKSLKTNLMYPLYKHGRKTKHFYTTDACNGCTLCEKICPISIISMHDGKPKWTADTCVQCLACLHRCPQKAIQHKKRTEKRGRYKNPNVKL